MPPTRKPLLPHRLLLERALKAAPFEKPALVVAPHPDDETFGCGGVIEEKRNRGVPVKIIILTDGSRSHGDLDETAKAALVARRQDETRTACAHLGVDAADVHFFALPDGDLSSLGEDTATALQILNLLLAVQAEEVFVTYRRDRHQDHEAAFTLTRAAIRRYTRAVRLYEYPVWVCHTPHRWLQRVGPRAALRSRTVILSDEALAHKREAAAAYASQHETLPPGFADLFLTGRELFFVSKVPAHK